MVKTYALELRFDSDLNTQVLNAGKVISNRGISCHLLISKTPPHITLFSGSYPPNLSNIINYFADKMKPYISLSLSSLQIFPGKRDLIALAPTPSLSLLNFHSDLCNGIREEGLEIAEEFKPGNWIPYCPLAEQVAETKVPKALTGSCELQLPLTGDAVRMTLVELLPSRHDCKDFGFWEPADPPIGGVDDEKYLFLEVLLPYT